MLEALLLPFVLMFMAAVLWFSFVPPRRPSALTLPERRLRSRFKTAGLFTLVVGLGASAAMDRSKRFVPEKDDDIIGYEIGAGYSYPIRASQSKYVVDQMERKGGKGGIAAAEGLRWFSHLWQGRKLATTLALVSMGGFVGCFFLARYLTEVRDGMVSKG